ncbi:MAG: sugar-binding domain-containing protein [Pseudomonadota bacterium]
MKTWLVGVGTSLVAVLLMVGCARTIPQASHDSAQVAERSASQRHSLNGQWRFRAGELHTGAAYAVDFDDREWTRISVPANWYLEGHDVAGVAWYRHHFSLPPAMADRRVRLEFQGVDYAADVWLNGHHIGFHEGYFQPFVFDVTDKLVSTGDNVLAVRVNSPYEEPSTAWSLNKRLIKGIFSHHDTRPGGAWSERGQEKNTGGIYAPVTLIASETVAIERLQVKPRVDSARGNVSAEIEVALSLPTQSAPRTVEVVVELMAENFDADSPTRIEKTAVLQPGAQTVQLALAPIEPRLWWPKEMGAPNLYRAKVSIRQGDRQLDQASDVFGFRRIERHRETGEWFVNGKRLFLRGTNYIATQWLSEMTPQKYRRDVSLMQDAHINIVRVHAHITGKAFYEACDRAGLLVWQDFPLQWGYEDSEEFHAEANRQAKDMVFALYNHPSIVTWSMHNEPPWDASWMKYKYPTYDETQNRELDDALYATVLALEDTRYVHRHSATAEHPWLGWYSGHWKDYAKPTEESLITEFGAQALPDVESLRRIVGDEHLWPTDDRSWRVWDYINFQRRETFEIAKVAQGGSVEELIDNTQQYQAQLIQFAIESYRRQRYEPVGGIFQFMLVEDWPSINWGVLDYWRNPKPGYFAMKRGFQPVLPSIEWQKQTYGPGESVTFNVWAINDLQQRFADAQLSVSVARDGDVVDEQHFPLDLRADSGRPVFAWSKSALEAGAYTADVVIEDANGIVLGENQYQFEVANRYASN